MRTYARLAIILALCITALMHAEAAQVVWSSISQGKEYQVAFVQTRLPSSQYTLKAWSHDLMMRCRPCGSRHWHEVARIEGVRLEKKVRIRHSVACDALVVSSPGGSARFISVVEITRSPAGFRTLLRDEADKGSYELLHDKRGMLVGLRFHYLAWHYEPDDGGVRGHVFTVRDLTWSPDSGVFRRGKIRIDEEAERKASLPALLMAIGADQYLNVKNIANGRDTVTLTYPPIGILKDKTPSALRSCPRVKAVIRRPYDYRKPDAVISLEASEK
jgi:hypothetical protein